MVETAVAQDDDTRFSSHLLGEFLLEQGLVSEEQLEAARVQLAALPVPEAIPMGVAFVPAADGKRLQLVDPVVGTSLGSLPLVPGDEGDGELEPVGWTRYADDQLLMLEPGELAPKRWLSMADCPTPGIIPTPAGAFLYPGAPPSRATSPRIAHLPSPWLNPAGVTGPLDLYPSPQGALLVAVNRGAGTVHVISVAERVQKGAVSLRPAGHQRGMGVAITPDQRTVYLSDGLTPRLGILDLASMKLRYQLFPTGPLGSLLLNHDGSQLLACFAKGPREMGLLTISLPDLRVKHLLNLPGKGEGERPILPLTPGFDEDSAFLVTYSFETRDQVYLLQMDRARQRIHKSHALREMPWMVCQPAPEAWCPEAPDLGTALLHMGVLSEDHLKVARAHLAGGGESVLSLATVPIDPGVLARLPERLIRDRGVIPLNEIDGNLIVAMGNPSDPRSRQFAIDLAGNLPVRVLPVTATEFEAFMQERYPALMDEYYAVSSGAPPSLRMPQELRSTVPLAQGARPDATDGPRAVSPAGEVRVAPVRAPAAPPTAALLATDDWGELPGERFLLINPLKRQVAELDRTGRSAWLYSPEGDTLTRRFSGFVHAARLENANTLVVDMGANRVQEVTPARSVTWQTAEDCRLKGPRHAIRLRTGGTLVVDTGNNRLVEVDADGQPAWTYGEMGCGGDGLFKPNYVCVLGNGRLLVTDTGNHRVIELETGKGVTWQYGNAGNRLGSGQGNGPNQLNEPSSALRLASGNTLVVDAGNQRVIEIDSLGTVVWTYRAADVRNGQGVRDPILARRRGNGNTVIAGRQGVCEVDADLAVVWEYHLLPPAVTTKAGPARPTVESVPAPAAAVVHVLSETELPPNLPQTFLQADRLQHRIWEVDRTKQLVWQHTGLGAAGRDRATLDRPHHVKRLKNGHVLVTDTGHHRVVELTPDGAIAWEFGEFGRLGAGAKQLSNPRSAERLTNGNTLIADQSNRRVIEVSAAGEVLWRYEGHQHRLQAPTYATRIPNGHLLVVDWGAHMVYEASPDGRIVWSYGELGRGGDAANCLFHPEHATRLPGGNTLIADTQNHRVIEVSPEGQIVWQYGGQPAYFPRVGRFGLNLLTPIAAWRLPSGAVVVQHAGKGHVVEVDPDLSITFQFAP